MVFRLYHVVMIGGTLFMAGIWVGIFIARDTVKYYQELLHEEQRKHHTQGRANFKAN